ncbi:MAG: phosphotransferase family protein [Hyphomicrobiales bacterium]
MDWRERFAAYARAKLPAAEDVRIGRLTGMPAGASNATVGIDLEVTCDGHTFGLPLVLRSERPDGLLAPYDIGRQYRIQRALQRTAVPVPPTPWYEPSSEVLGTPFFVMVRLQAETLPLFWYSAHSARLDAAAAMLATIHGVEWEAAGLGFLLPAGASTPLEAELAQWRVRADHLEVAGNPMLLALGHWLARNEPADARLAFVHGDPNPGNSLFRGDEVVAVVDWELAALGDPRSDLGFYAALTAVFGGMPGPGGRSVLSDAYERVTGVPLANLEYYEAFGLYRMAIVMAGWAGRVGGFGYYGSDVIARRLAVLLGPNWMAGS